MEREAAERRRGTQKGQVAMPKRKNPEKDPQEQFKRFVEAAKDKGVDERKSAKEFKRLVPKSDKKSGAQ